MSFSRSWPREAFEPSKHGQVSSDQVTRVRQEEGKVLHLDTAIQRWQNPAGQVVDLIGAIHLGTKRYYDQLNRLLSLPEVVLFEMVGGESIRPFARARKGQTEPELLAPSPLGFLPDDELEVQSQLIHNHDGWLNRIYHSVAKALELELQSDCINYQRDSFIHADLSQYEFQKAQKERKESILKFLLSRPTQFRSNRTPYWCPWRAWMAAIKSDAMHLREELIRQIGPDPNFLNSKAINSVILGLRNQRCLAILDQELTQGHQHLAIFYGAAHLPHLGQELRQRSFTCTDQSWIEAW